MVKIKIKLEDFLIGLLSGMAIMFISVIIIFSSSSYVISLNSDFEFYIEEEKVDDVIEHKDKIYISAEKVSDVLDYKIDLGKTKGRMYLDKEEALAEKDKDIAENNGLLEKEDEQKDEAENLSDKDISGAVWEAKNERAVILVKAINKSLEAKKKLQKENKGQITVDEAFDLLIKRTGDDPETLFYIEDTENDSKHKSYNFVYSSDEKNDKYDDIYYSVDKLTGTIDISTSISTDSASVIPYSKWKKE